MPRIFALPGRTWDENTWAVITYENLEKSLWFHAHLAFEVIPGTCSCTLIKCLWCVDHTCGGVCGTVRKGSYCEFWLPPPGVPGTSCHFSLRSTLLSWADSSVGSRRVTICNQPVCNSVIGFLKDTVGHSEAVHLSWGSHRSALCVQWSQYSVHHFDCEKTLKRSSLLQIYEPIRANAAQKSWLSAPPGKCWSVRHIFITLVQYHTGQLNWEELNVFLPSLSSLTDKLVNCMCGIGSRLCVWTPEAEVVGLY